MDKNAIKKFAVWARRELIARVTKRAEQYGIAKDSIVPAGATSVFDRLLSTEEMRQRKALIERIESGGYEHVMEEIAYTWFNRFIALRFMEVNGYLPSHVRVFTDDAGALKPQILAEALHMELDGLDKEKVYACKQANKTDELYKYLLITQCNALSTLLPGMFQKLADYTELLFPDNILREGSVIEQMIATIPEQDWTDQVQIIGWLYQYYNSEPKELVFANLKKNIKIGKNDIPAATQLFTPDWIVRYMVENSLGRLWVEGHPNGELKASWKYYLEEAEQEPEVQAKLAEIRKGYAALKPEDLRCVDPCMGSGHILAYLFDVLMQIYGAYGVSPRDAVRSILENNLYGLDIDDRAAQLAYFAVMMKARQYDRRFFTRGIQPHIHSVMETNSLGGSYKLAMGDFLLSKEHQETLNYLLDAFIDAKEYGSILQLDDRDYIGLMEAWKYTASQTAEDFNLTLWYSAVEHEIPKLIEQAIMFTQKYDVVVTNPPYMGASGMGAKLGEFVKAKYPDTKSDMSTVFMERTIDMCKHSGYMAMINIPVWMFLSSYEKLRHNLLTQNTMSSMVHPGRGIFGSDFGTTSFVIAKEYIKGYKGSYRRLFDKQGEVETIEVREQRFFEGRGCFTACQDNFAKIPGAPVAYWIYTSWFSHFKNYPVLRETNIMKKGMSTGDNERFIRMWHEVSRQKTCYSANSPTEALASGKKWFPVNTGGERRLWYGNRSDVVNWENDGELMKTVATQLNHGQHWSRYIVSPDKFFLECITWSAISSSRIGVRYMGFGFAFTSAAMAVLGNDIRYVMGLVNSKVADNILTVLAPTINFGVEQIGRIPLILSRVCEVNDFVNSNLLLSHSDWDSFETSWDFIVHPLVKWAKGLWGCTGIGATMDKYYGDKKPKEINSQIELCHWLWKGECNKRFTQLKSNEEELNRIFIDIYSLQDELTPEVADKDVTVYRVIDEPNPEERGMHYVLSRRDVIVSLISYAVGCMFGRYSLDKPGLLFAGGDWNEIYTDFCRHNPVTFAADKDNILPICDDEYFPDDIVSRFVKFIEVVYGKDTLDENLRFIADALGGAGQPKDVIRAYFLNDFYADHLKTYQKRPIYWLFDSGKKNGFKALIYMHRYQPDTIARVRTDYVHEQQSRYRTAIADLENRVATASASERVKLTKRLNAIRAQADELRTYEEKIHHLADQMIRIDLDDGVKHNYEIFGDVLAKIK